MHKKINLFRKVVNVSMYSVMYSVMIASLLSTTIHTRAQDISSRGLLIKKPLSINIKKFNVCLKIHKALRDKKILFFIPKEYRLGIDPKELNLNQSFHLRKKDGTLFRSYATINNEYEKQCKNFDNEDFDTQLSINEERDCLITVINKKPDLLKKFTFNIPITHSVLSFLFAIRDKQKGSPAIDTIKLTGWANDNTYTVSFKELNDSTYTVLFKKLNDHK